MIAGLLAIMAKLRDPDGGCPWDLQQTFATIAPYTIEEAYEVADAIDRNDMADLRDELGDLLLQVCSMPAWRRSRAHSPSPTSSRRSATRCCAGIRMCSPAQRSRTPMRRRALGRTQARRARANGQADTCGLAGSPVACRNGSAR
jgi:hypothetical protein